jgi:hypothetical protein
VYEPVSADTLIRIAAIKNLETGSVSIAVINRNDVTKQLNLKIKTDDGKKPFRKYLYDPGNVPFNYFGDLQNYSKKISMSDGQLSDTIPPQSLVVYTTSYDEESPSDIKSLNVEIRKTDGRDKAFLKWEPNTEKDFCYYRIYRSEKPEVEIIPRKQIASTISNEFIDMSINDMPKYYYHIVAVDQSGNTSK